MNKVLTDIKKNLSKASVNKKLYVFLVCLFLSTFYWLINVLGNQYTSELLIDVVYKNQPEKHVVLSELPTNLKIVVTTDGYTLLAYQIKIKKPVVEINLDDYQFEIGENSNEILVDDFRHDIEKQLGKKIEINEISPKKITVVLDDKIVKTLKVIPHYKLTFNNQYQLSDSVIVTPNNIDVSGPKQVLDTLNYIPTEFAELKNIEGSIQKTIQLDANFLKKNYLQAINTKIEINIVTDKFTEYKLMLPIKISNNPDSIDVNIIPENIEIKFMIPLSKISLLNPEEFNAIIDFNEQSKIYKKLKVHLVKHPSFLKSITIKPANVEYVLKRK